MYFYITLTNYGKTIFNRCIRPDLQSILCLLKSPRINSKGLNTSAILGFVNILEDILTKESPTHIGVAFDPPAELSGMNYIKNTKLKRGDAGSHQRIRTNNKTDIGSIQNTNSEVPGFEADDVIGTLSKRQRKGATTYMMTPDKDFCQLVTDRILLYRPKYGNNGYEILGPANVQKNGLKSTAQVIEMLGLMGDSSDNIRCPGVGEKTAIKLLDEFGDIDTLLANTDKVKGALREKLKTTGR